MCVVYPPKCSVLQPLKGKDVCVCCLRECKWAVGEKWKDESVVYMFFSSDRGSSEAEERGKSLPSNGCFGSHL